MNLIKPVKRIRDDPRVPSVVVYDIQSRPIPSERHSETCAHSYCLRTQRTQHFVRREQKKKKNPSVKTYYKCTQWVGPV